MWSCYDIQTQIGVTINLKVETQWGMSLLVIMLVIIR